MCRPYGVFFPPCTLCGLGPRRLFPSAPPSTRHSVELSHHTVASLPCRPPLPSSRPLRWSRARHSMRSVPRRPVRVRRRDPRTCPTPSNQRSSSTKHTHKQRPSRSAQRRRCRVDGDDSSVAQQWWRRTITTHGHRCGRALSDEASGGCRIRPPRRASPRIDAHFSLRRCFSPRSFQAQPGVRRVEAEHQGGAVRRGSDPAQSAVSERERSERADGDGRCGDEDSAGAPPEKEAPIAHFEFRAVQAVRIKWRWRERRRSLGSTVADGSSTCLVCV